MHQTNQGPMSMGRILYELFHRCQLAYHVETDKWADLDDTDRDAWSDLARMTDFELSDEVKAIFGIED